MAPPPPASPPAARAPRRRYGGGDGIVDGLGVPLVFLTLAGFLGSLHWVVDLTSPFRVQYALGLAVLVPIAAARRRWRRLVVLGVGLAANLWLVLPLWLPLGAAAVGPEGGGAGPELRLVTANVLRSNPRRADALRAIADERPDVVALIEVDRAWLAASAEHLLGYRVVIARPRSDFFGIALLLSRESEWDARARVAWMPPGDLPAVDAVLRHPSGAEWGLLAMHPLPPTSRRNSAARDDALAAAAAWARNVPGRPKLVAGDLNATPFNAAFRRLARDAELTPALLGHGPCPTWPDPARLPAPLASLGMISIDHVLHGPQLVASRYDTISRTGSDHRFVSVTIRAAPGGAGEAAGPVDAFGPRLPPRP